MRILIICCLIVGLGNCNQIRADNLIHIDQVGDNNIYVINQEGSGQTVNIAVGKFTASDGNVINVDQKDATAKTANITVNSGINNSISVLQQGIGNHIASVQNLNGSANTINISQSGSGNHEFNVVNGAGTTNNNNSITGTQNGNTNADKWFTVNLNGATGANVSVSQTNPNSPNQASMNISCMPGTCGNWSYNTQ